MNDEVQLVTSCEKELMVVHTSVVYLGKILKTLTVCDPAIEYGILLFKLSGKTCQCLYAKV